MRALAPLLPIFVVLFTAIQIVPAKANQKFHCSNSADASYSKTVCWLIETFSEEWPRSKVIAIDEDKCTVDMYDTRGRYSKVGGGGYIGETHKPIRIFFNRVREFVHNVDPPDAVRFSLRGKKVYQYLHDSRVFDEFDSIGVMHNKNLEVQLKQLSEHLNTLYSRHCTLYVSSEEKRRKRYRGLQSVCRSAKIGTYSSNVCWLIETVSKSLAESAEKSSGNVFVQGMMQGLVDKVKVVEFDRERCTADIVVNNKHSYRINFNESNGQMKHYQGCYTLYGENIAKSLDASPFSSGQFTLLQAYGGTRNITIEKNEFSICGTLTEERTANAINNLYSKYCELRNYGKDKKVEF